MRQASVVDGTGGNGYARAMATRVGPMRRLSRVEYERLLDRGMFQLGDRLELLGRFPGLWDEMLHPPARDPALVASARP